MKNFLFVRKNSFKILLVMILYFSVGAAYSSDSLPKQLHSSSTTFNKINSLKICVSKACIYEFNALRDLYPKQKIEIIDNYGMIENKKLIHIIYSAKFKDDKDLYAIFIAQENEINGEQGISTCNACGARLGIVIYQYHNKWKLFGANDNLTIDGAMGKIKILDNSISIYSQAAEKFIITYDDYGQSQGYESTNRNIIVVNEGLHHSISTDVKANIKYYGYFTIAESSCNAKKDGEYWSGLISLEKSNNSMPVIKMEKSIRSCLNKKLTKKINLIAEKIPTENKLLLNTIQ